MNRKYKEIFLGIGLFFIILIPLWIIVVAPRLLQLPTNFSYTADLQSFDNFYDQASQSFAGKTQSNSSFNYNVTAAQPGVLTIKNSFDVQTLAGTQIIHVDRLYGVDPVTGQHVPGFGDHDRTGYLFAPHNLKAGQDFTYWHVNYDAPAAMHYKGTEDLYGLTTYHYETILTPDQTDNLGNLPNVGETLGINSDVVLDVWIEPTTGWLVKYADKAVAYYYDLGDKTRLNPWDSSSNTYTEESVLQQVLRAQQERTLNSFVGQVIPLLFFGLGLLCIVPITLGRFKNMNQIIRRTIPFLVCLVGIGLSLFGWFFTRDIIQRQTLIAFQGDVSNVTKRILDRMDIYRNALEGGKSLFVASDTVTGEQWKNYVAGIDLQTNYPGIQGMGYAADNTDSTSVMYLEPFDQRNQRAFGYNMSSKPLLQQAMGQACDSGAAVATGKVDSMQKTNQANQTEFLLYVPYYGHNPVYTVTDRRAAIKGYVYSPFWMNDFINGIFHDTASTVAFNIYDDAIGKTKTGLMYQDPAVDVVQSSTLLNSAARHIFVFGHRWDIDFVQLPSSRYASTFETAIPWIVLIAGVVVSDLFAVLLYVAERGYLSIKRPLRHHKKSS